MTLVEFLYSYYPELISIVTFGRKNNTIFRKYMPSKTPSTYLQYWLRYIKSHFFGNAGTLEIA